jgi:hypothetical protein
MMGAWLRPRRSTVSVGWGGRGATQLPFILSKPQTSARGKTVLDISVHPLESAAELEGEADAMGPQLSVANETRRG